MDSRKRTWLVTAVGLLVGVVSLFAGQTIDAVLNARMPNLGAFLGHYVLAGTTFAVAFSPVVRAALPERGTRVGVGWLALQPSTVGFFLFLVPTLVAVPDSTGRWLPYFYAASILVGWLAWPLSLLSSQQGPVSFHRVVDWDRMPYALFVVVALILLIVSSICSAANQSSATIQLTNWAYGFLLIAVLIASLDHLLNLGPTERFERFFRFALSIAALAFFPLASFVDANSHSRTESLVITDVYPNFLAEQQRPGDILISDSPSLRLNKLPRIATSVNVNPDERGIALWDDLTRALNSQQRALWITVPGQSRDTRGGLATFLKANGCLDYVSNTSLPVQVYELNKPLYLPHVLSPFWAAQTADAFDPVQVNFGPIQMTGLRLERRVCSHDSVAVAMRWQLTAKTASPFKVSLFLSDAKGRRIHMQDFDIADPSQHHTDQWQPGAAWPAYYLLNVSLGTPPGLYKLGAGVYPVSQPHWLRVSSAEGAQNRLDHVEIGAVEVYRAQDVSADRWKSREDSALLPANVAMADGLVLDGYQVANPSIIPGESLHLALRWRAAKDGLPSYTTKVSLWKGNKAFAEESGIPVDGMYPSNLWKSGEYVTEHKDLRLPADAAGGLARLEVSVAPENTGLLTSQQPTSPPSPLPKERGEVPPFSKGNGPGVGSASTSSSQFSTALAGQPAYLADINIEPITRTYQIPVIGYSTRASFKGIGDLVGYDLPKTPFAANQPIEMRVYWRAGASVEKDYTVFAQLLAADGHLIAQSDSQPALGRRPTRSWLPGEIVRDQHTLDFRDQGYQGEAKLIVGFYDAETGERVPLEGAADNFFLLPTRVQVVAK